MPTLKTENNDIYDFSSGKLTQNVDYKYLLKRLDKEGKRYKVVFLPDTHIKQNLESPSSAAYAIKDSFSLKLTSPSPNCGMALVQLPLSAEELNDDSRISAFFSDFCTKVPLDRKDHILSKNQVIKVLREGASALVDIFDMDPRHLENIEFRGNIFDYTSSDNLDIQKLIPDFLTDMSQYRFGILGGGNHFLEFQQVDEIYNPKVASDFSIRNGQAALLFHTGSEAIGSLIGRIYAHRKKTSLKLNARLFPPKFKFHVRQYNWKNLYKYFSTKDFPFFPDDVFKSQNTINAYHAAFNFGYANRYFILNKIKESLTEAFNTKIDINLLVDLSHNSIINEQIQGEKYWLHRHNSVRIAPLSELNNHPLFAKHGHPIVIPGTNRTSTYICIRGEHTDKSLHSVDHGFGNLLNHLPGSEKFPEKNMTSKMYSYIKNGFEEQKLIADDVLWNTIRYLEGEGILKPVARLRPFATLKGPRPRIN